MSWSKTQLRAFVESLFAGEEHDESENIKKYINPGIALHIGLLGLRPVFYYDLQRVEDLGTAPPDSIQKVAIMGKFFQDVGDYLQLTASNARRRREENAPK